MRRTGLAGDGTAPRGKEGLTLLDTLPHPILLCLTQTGHALRVSPPQEISLFQLTHERLLARLGAWCDE